MIFNSTHARVNAVLSLLAVLPSSMSFGYEVSMLALLDK